MLIIFLFVLLASKYKIFFKETYLKRKKYNHFEVNFDWIFHFFSLSFVKHIKVESFVKPQQNPTILIYFF